MKTTATLEKELARAAKDMGVSKVEALRKAVSFYRKQRVATSLREELLLWDRVSTEDFSSFERKI